MEGLLAICEREGISVHYLNPLTRSGNVLGFYCRLSCGEHVILLDASLQKNKRLARWVLAEELAHYFEGTTGQRLYPTDRPTNRDCVRADESRAVRRAVNYLIPTPDLAEAAKNGICTVAELCEYFDVEEWVVWKKFHILRTDLREQWRLRVVAPDVMSPLLVNVMWVQAC